MGLLPERRGKGKKGLPPEIKTRIKALLLENPDLRVSHLQLLMKEDARSLDA